MKRSSLTILAIASLAASGCSDDVDLSGTYAVNLHRVDDSGCSAGTVVADSPPYIRFTQEEFFGQEYYEWNWCTDSSDASCLDASGYSLYGEPISGGWKSELTFSSWFGTDCSVGSSTSTAVLEQEVLRIETRHRQGMFQIEEGDCEPELAEERADEMTCVQLETIDAAPL
jgi:hypothetical protein